MPNVCKGVLTHAYIYLHSWTAHSGCHCPLSVVLLNQGAFPEADPGLFTGIYLGIWGGGLMWPGHRDHPRKVWFSLQIFPVVIARSSFPCLKFFIWFQALLRLLGLIAHNCFASCHKKRHFEVAGSGKKVGLCVLQPSNAAWGSADGLETGGWCLFPPMQLLQKILQQWQQGELWV